MGNFVVVLASEELGTWPKRLLGLHAYNNLELEGTTEATYTLHQPLKQMQKLQSQEGSNN